MCAYFRVTGEDFDVDRFLVNSTIGPDVVFHRGQTKRRLKEQTWLHSGFGLEIGGKFGELTSQIDEIVAFLEDQRRELLRLSKFPGVSDKRFILSYCPGSRANLTEYFSAKMLVGLGSMGIGMELDVYPGDNEWQKQEHDKDSNDQKKELH